MLKMNKEEFMNTAMGVALWKTVKAIDFYCSERAKTCEWENPKRFEELKHYIDRLMAKWEIFRLALKQFYGIEYNLTRTDEYYGVCTDDESDFLIKEERK